MQGIFIHGTAFANMNSPPNYGSLNSIFQNSRILYLTLRNVQCSMIAKWHMKGGGGELIALLFTFPFAGDHFPFFVLMGEIFFSYCQMLLLLLSNLASARFLALLGVIRLFLQWFLQITDAESNAAQACRGERPIISLYYIGGRL